LLFIIDGACLVVTEARTTLAWHRQTARPAATATPPGRAAGIVTARPRRSQNDGSARP